MRVVTENNLTNVGTISYLLSKEETEIMHGKIKARGKCPICQCSFIEVSRLGFICEEHRTTPKRFYIDVYKGKRFKIFSDQTGRPLDSYHRARDLLVRINQEIQDKTFDPSQYVKSELQNFYVTTLLDGFLAHKLEGDSIAPSYRSHYKRYLGIARKYFKNKDARDLRKLDLVNYISHIKKNYDFSNKTLKNCIELFKVFLSYLKSDLEILQVVPTFPEIYVKDPQTRWLTQEVQTTVFNHIADEDKPIIAFLMLSGCRPGEARALKCKDIDLVQGSITISATFSGSFYCQRRKGKGSKDLVIPIHPEILDYVKDRVENNLPEAFIFTHVRGLHYSKSKLDRVWNAARDKAGLEKSIRLYDATRHSFASQLVNIGVSSEKVSRLLGHSSTKMTARYMHHELDNLKVDINAVSLKPKVEKFADKRNVDNLDKKNN